MSSSKRPSGSIRNNPSRLPENVLVIRYSDLASDSATRLEVVAGIGKLLSTAKQSALLPSLVSSPTSVQGLCAWLEGDEASRFWQLEQDSVTSLVPCEKHILVGTGQLLRDLGILMNTSHSSRLTDVDLVWQAAIRLTEKAEEE